MSEYQRWMRMPMGWKVIMEIVGQLVRRQRRKVRTHSRDGACLIASQQLYSQRQSSDVWAAVDTCCSLY